MTKKRFFLSISIVTFLVLILVLVSCGKKADQPTGEQKEPTQAPASQSGQIPAQPGGAPPAGGGQQQGMGAKGAQPPPDTFLTKVSPQTVVARVNGTDVKAWLIKEISKIHKDQITKQIGMVPPEMEAGIAQTSLDQAIKSELLYQQALKEGVKADEKVVQDDIKSVKMAFPNEQSFKDFLQAAGYGEDEFTRETRKNLIINSYLKDKIVPLVRVSEKEAKEYYDKNPSDFDAKELVRASYILFPFSEDTPEERKALLKTEADNVLKELKSGKDFAEMAKKYSKAPNAEKGGDLGYFPRGKMLSHFEKIAFSLGIGQISDVFETQFGYNILKVTDKKPAGKMPYEEIKMKLIDRLMKVEIEKTINDKLETLKKQAKIEILVKDAQLPNPSQKLG